MEKTNLSTALSLFLLVLSSATLTLLPLGISDAFCADDLIICELLVNAQDLPQEIVHLETKQEIARSGCCSWHGGVCDCILGRVVCCDGTVSPSCLCNQGSNKGLIDAKNRQ